MLDDKKITVIIPALNEESTLPLVLNDISRELVDEIVVVDNGSKDRTVEIAREAGATVLHETKKGYGYPCLTGIEHIKTNNADVVVFVDGNYSDHPDEIEKLVEPVIRNDYDLVLGSRTLGQVEEGALRIPVQFGNWLATVLIRIFYNFRFTDVGPFRAIKFNKLLELDMNDNLGWTIEMQVKAVRKKYRITEVPVSYRAGTGKSKLTGNLRGIVLVGYRIIRAIVKNLFYSR
jgi:glycosyltransferase involved in cell wall biosynthesis